MRKLNQDVQAYFFHQIFSAYEDKALHFDSSTLEHMLDSCGAIEVHLDAMDGGFNDRLVVMSEYPQIIHVVEKDGKVKSVSAMTREEALESNLFAGRLNAYQEYMVGTY